MRSDDVTMMRHTLVLAASIAAGIATTATGAAAQSYPDKPIRLIVPAGPGGPNDVLARLLAQHLQPRFGATFVVDNRAGAGGLIGARAAATADPDGYTLLIGNTATLANIPAFSRTVGYDPVRSFTPVAKITDSYQVLAVRADFPARSVAELIALAKANPGRLNFSSGGAGNLTHLSGELLKLKAAIDIVHVPYKSTAEAVTAVLGDQEQLTFGGISVLLPLLREGKLRALAVTSAGRAGELPDVSTMIESGVPDYVVTSFFGVVAPVGTPAGIVDRLARAINAALADPEMVAGLRRLGAEPGSGSPQEFAAFIASELAKWQAVAASAGISID
jgi:tripartite-type tricarboxylate transporter receptor subunit TctC